MPKLPKSEMKKENITMNTEELKRIIRSDFKSLNSKILKKIKRKWVIF
jgi:hypothetical protein